MGTARSRGLPQPEDCHILENAKSLKGKRKMIENETSWMLQDPGYYYIVDTGKSS